MPGQHDLSSSTCRAEAVRGGEVQHAAILHRVYGSWQEAGVAAKAVYIHQVIVILLEEA
jgi:hypothetical protein